MSVRKSIHTDIVESLKGITKANGFNNDVALVTKREKTIESVTVWPTLCVLAGQDTTEMSGNQDLYRGSLVFGIVGFGQTATDVSDEGLIADAAQDLIEDIENRLIRDTSLVVGADASAKLLTITGEQPLFDYDKNEYSVQVNVVVEFYHAQGQT